jgi:hypothetical protein
MDLWGEYMVHEVRRHAVIAVAMLVCSVAAVTQAEAAITLADLNVQAQQTIGALNASTLATDEFTALTGQVHGAFNRWQSTWALSLAYYSAGDLYRGDMYAAAATVDQGEYDRLMALVPAKQIDVENKRQAYLREYARFNAMLDAYDRQ